MESSKASIINRLQKDILQWQGFVPPAAGKAKVVGLGSLEASFPNGVFPTGAIHELICEEPEHAAATGGFISGIISTLMNQGGICVWISLSAVLFPPSLALFGVEADRVIFINLQREKDILWVAEEALKCEGIAAVIAELREMNFMQTRRLQLCVEQSHVTGFILRSDPKRLTANACVARWKITSLPSELPDGIPGVGFPRWNIELLKVRNGNPGIYRLEWADGRFNEINKVVDQGQRKAG